MDEFSEGLKSGMIEWVEESTLQAYLDAIRSCSAHGARDGNGELSVVYTALHGTGNGMCLRALKDLGMENVVSVEEQQCPNGNFPTVTSPNPENPEALRMAVDLMVEKAADIAMGTDPDTDRVGVAVRHKGEIFIPTAINWGYCCSTICWAIKSWERSLILSRRW